MFASIPARVRGRKMRVAFLLGSALPALLAMPTVAGAQELRLPTERDVVGTPKTSLLGSSPQISNRNDEVRVNLRATNTVIDWNGFNIPENQKAFFTSDRSTAVAVLNRDVSMVESRLLGELGSNSNVAVWIINPNGILVGNKAKLNTGSLVLTTLNVTDTDFLGGGSTYSFKGDPDKTSGIKINPGATITVSGGNRGLVMVAPQIEAEGTFKATGQDVAFVTALDVTLTYNANSPLSVRLDKGTPIAGRSQFVGGTVDGNNVTFALASQKTITDSLLQVTADVTTATAGSRGIILSAGRPASSVSGVTGNGASADIGGIAALDVSGVLNAQNNSNGTSDIIAAATGTARFDKGLTAQNVSISAGGALTVASGIGATGNLTLAGNGVALGDTVAVTQSANGTVSITARDGNIVGTGPLTIRSGSGSLSSMTLATEGTMAGDILFGSDSRLIAGGALTGTGSFTGGLVLRTRAAANLVTIGDISAGRLRGAIGTGALEDKLDLTSAVTFGNVDVRDALTIGAGAITADSITVRAGSATLVAGTDVNVIGRLYAEQNTSDVIVNAPGTVALGDVRAGRAFTVGNLDPAAVANIGGDVTVGQNYAVTADTIVLGGARPATRQAASGSVALTAGAGGITGVSGLTVVANADGSGNEGMTLAINPARVAPGGGDQVGRIDFALDTRLLGGSQRQSDISIRSADADGVVALGDVFARTLESAIGNGRFSSGITRNGALRTGDISLRGDVLLNGADVMAGALESSTGEVRAKAVTGIVSTGKIEAARGVSIESVGALTVDGGINARSGLLRLRGGSVGFSTGDVRGAGAIDIFAGSGGISSTGAIALSSSSTASNDYVRLQAAGPEGIVFAPGSAITAGNNGTLHVRVLNQTPDAPLTLGNVTARSLATLGAVDGDPIAPGLPIVAGGSLSFGRLNLIDSFAAQSTAGNLSVESISVTGANQGIDLRAENGSLSVPRDVTASGDITLISGADLTLGSVVSRNRSVTVQSGGVLQSGSLAGATGVTATGVSLMLGNVIGGNGATVLTANAGDMNITGARGASIDLNATGVIEATGLIAADSGKATLTAGSTLNARGGVTARDDITLSGGDMTLGAVESRQGSVTLERGGVVEGGRMTGATGVTGNGASFTLGDVIGGSGAVVLQASAGDVTIASANGAAIDLGASGAIGATGLISANSGTAVLSAGSTLTATGGVVARDAITLTGTDMTLGAIESRDQGVIIQGSGIVRGVRVAGATGVDGTGASFMLGDLIGGSGLAKLTATAGDLIVASANGAAIDFGASGAINVPGAIVANNGFVSLVAGSTTTATGGISARGDVVLSGTALTLGGVHRADGTYTATTTAGSIDGRPGLSIQSDADSNGAEGIELTATGGGIALGNAELRIGSGRQGAIALTTDGAGVRAGDVSGGSLTVTGASAPDAAIQLGVVTLNDALVLAAAGDVITGGVTLDNGGLTATAGGAARFGTITTTAGTTSLTGQSVDFGTVNAGQFSATAKNGGITGGDVTTDGLIDATTTNGAMTLGRVTSRNGNVALTATGGLFARLVDAGGTADLTSTSGAADVTVAEGVAATDSVTVRSGRDIVTPFIRSRAGNLTVSAPNGSVRGFQSNAGTDLAAGLGRAFSLTVGTAANLGNVDATDISITATAIRANRINGGDQSVTLRATAGDLIVTDRITGGDVTLEATGQTTLTSVEASGILEMTGRTGLSFTNVSGASVTADGGTIRGNALISSASAEIRGSDITIGSLGAGGVLGVDATGALTVDTAQTGGDINFAAGSTARVTGAVAAGGAFNVTGGSVELGGASGVVQRGAGVRVTSASGDISGATGLQLVGGGNPVLLDSAGAIRFAGTEIIATDAPLSLRAGAGNAIRLGTLTVGSIGGLDGTISTDRLIHGGAFEAGDITAGRINVTTTAGSLTTGTITAGGAVALNAAAGALTVGDIAAASLDGRASGILTARTAQVAGAASLEAGAIAVRDVTAGSLTVKTSGALSDVGGGRANLRTTSGDLTIDAGTARLATADSAAVLTVRGNAIDSSRLAAAGRLLAEAREALTTGSANAGADLSLKAGGTLTSGAAVAGGTWTVEGGAVAIESARSGAAMTLTSRGDVSLGSGTTSAGISVKAGGLATVGALSGGPTVAITAGDARLTGAVRAGTVSFATAAPATTVMRIGDGLATTGGFQLSNAEVGLVAADTLRFDAGAGTMEVGSLALGSATGRTIQMLSLGDVRVAGEVSSSGTGRSIRIGGDAGEGSAAQLRVEATESGGGRLLVDGADLELRANRIAVGLKTGFVDPLLTGDAGPARAIELVTNPNSALYNSLLGGGAFSPDATTTIAARSLTVRFGDYALFQNTAIPGKTSGVVIGGTTTAPVTPALRVIASGGSGPQAGAFALFGSINGETGAAAALLGDGTIDITRGLLPNARINGCLVGSAAGCLTTIVIQPTLQVFDWNSEAVFGIRQDVAVPFAPIVSANNEEMLTGLPELFPADMAEPGPPATGPMPATATVPSNGQPQ